MDQAKRHDLAVEIAQNLDKAISTQRFLIKGNSGSIGKAMPNSNCG
ncbi:MAG: hypothetical protein ABI045_02625 [Flavobacteriales bacterium]